MNKKFLYIAIGCLIGALIIVGYHISTKPLPESNMEKIDSLENAINKQTILRDSIQTVIDTNTVTIKEIHKTYEKNIRTIINQSYDADLQFLRDYLSRYSVDSTGLKKIKSDSSTAR